ncbi:MAG: hypothetical protein U0360_08855 [Dehalococcoidia bacterium]
MPQLSRSLLERYVPMARDCLVTAARYHQTVPYADVIDSLRGAGRGYVGQVLDELNVREHQAGRPLLSAIVVDRAGGQPGDGFFDLVKRLRGVAGDRQAIWEAERDVVFLYYSLK